jgi:hypothetical protein
MYELNTHEIRATLRLISVHGARSGSRLILLLWQRSLLCRQIQHSQLLLMHNTLLVHVEAQPLKGETNFLKKGNINT